MAVFFCVFVAGVIPTQKEKKLKKAINYTGSGLFWTQLGLCILHSVGEADQGCRHLGATLFELDVFLSNQRKSVTSMSAYWDPLPTPTHKPVPTFPKAL